MVEGSHTQRIQKTPEDANIKLDSVISDIVGISGRRMIEALIAGGTDPQALEALADGRLKATPAELEAWPGDGPSPLHATSSSGHQFIWTPVGCSGRGHWPHGYGGRLQRRTLSRSPSKC